RLGLAVRPARRGGLLGDGGALHARAAAHLAPRALVRAALRTPAPLLHRVQARSPAVAAHALPLELHLAVGVALGQALPPSQCGDLVHRVLRLAQPLVGAAFAPVALPDRVRYRAPAMPLGALPFHQRETVDVGLGHATAASPGGIALDFVE